MRYLLIICSDGQAYEAKRAAMVTGIGPWIESTGDARLYGRRLGDVDTAVTVRTRGGEVFASNGPFAESKEWMVGFDIIDAPDLDAAIAIAAAHPVAAFHSVEVRPFIEHTDEENPGALPSGETDDLAPGRSRYLMLMCVDGVPEPDEEEAAVRRNGRAWAERLAADGTFVWGGPLQGAEAATSVRVRDGETLIADGPFVEAKEFIAGLAIVDVAGQAEAVALAGQHPLAHYHRVEVRPFWEDARG